jgi:hypothetical protein
MIKYVVRLHPEEREQLLALVNTGRAAAVKLLHARILRKADVGAESCRWTDAAVADALDTSASSVRRVRRPLSNRAWKWPWLASARQVGSIANWMGPRRAQLIAMACRAPPAGRVRWTLQ